MTEEVLNILTVDRRARQNLAKYIALHCFRNTFLEDLYAGRVPQSQTGDYSDVKVVTPSVEIPWNQLSRLSDREMKELMIDVVNHCDALIPLMLSEGFTEIVKGFSEHDIPPEWYDPPYDGTGDEKTPAMK